MNSVTFSLIAGVISLLAFGIANSFVKIPCQKISSRHFIVYKGIFCGFFLFIVLLFTWQTQNFDMRYVLFSLLIALVGYIGMSFFYKAMEIGKVGIVSPVAATTIVFSILFTVLFLGSKITLPQIAAILIILLGLMFIKLDFRDLKNSLKRHSVPGFSEAMFHTVFMGTYVFLGQIPNNVLGFVLYPLVGEIGMALFGWSYIKHKKQKLAIPDKKTFALMALLGLFLTVGILALFGGLKYGDPIIVFPLYYSSPLVVTVIGWFYYKERLHPQQYLAIAAIIVGAIILRLCS